MTTLVVPLKPPTTVSPLPSSFLVQSKDPETQTNRVVKAILKAKRIIVVSGAGISVQAGVPAFRSGNGLFESLKRDNPRELSSGKDLFDASVFNSEPTTVLFCQMIARLSELSDKAEPTPFHHLLRALNDRGKVLRVLTQNIDALEERLLSFGVPEFDDKRRIAKSKAVLDPSVIRLPSPPAEIPTCIPLHGTLQSLHCQSCTHSFPLRDYLPSLSAGMLPDCPECSELEQVRSALGKRQRGIGKLRPSVVLYNETHRNGEGVGNVVGKDLLAKGRSGADLLLVVGTSLKVPGTKRIVREFSKAVRSRVSSRETAVSTGLQSPSSPNRTPAPEANQVTSIYLNFDFPVPTREWEGVFDVWVQGDAQRFAEIVKAEMEKEKEESVKKSPSKKRKLTKEDRTSSAKRRKQTMIELPTPPRTPLTIRIPARPKPTSTVTLQGKTITTERSPHTPKKPGYSIEVVQERARSASAHTDQRRLPAFGYIDSDLSELSETDEERNSYSASIT